jgi:hypothetical protein
MIATLASILDSPTTKINRVKLKDLRKAMGDGGVA